MSLLIFTPVMRPLFPFWKARKKRCLLRQKRHANWLPAQLLQINRLFYFLKMGICAWRMCSILLNFSCLFDIAVFLLLSKFTMASFCFSPLIIPQIFGLRWLTMWSDGSCSRSCAPHSCCACNFFSLKKKTKMKNIKNENKKKCEKTRQIAIMFQWNKKIYLEKISNCLLFSFVWHSAVYATAKVFIGIHSWPIEEESATRNESWRFSRSPYKERDLVLSSFTWSSWCR